MPEGNNESKKLSTDALSSKYSGTTPSSWNFAILRALELTGIGTTSHMNQKP